MIKQLARFRQSESVSKKYSDIGINTGESDWYTITYFDVINNIFILDNIYEVDGKDIELKL